ncbi:Wzz/FepE/Etk N-terminal domain-containing protein [Deinococcus multiflagellatus]|uniref:Wzz/FepE/Etk N-terminal domain-containing protein n=1 Tax=Deinococcus multiflagellatus TaxID=1656887 RepID=A0ABW1ZLI0_9DEIO
MTTFRSAAGSEIHLASIIKTLQRSLWQILALAVLLAGLGYVLSKRQAPVYQATAVIATALPDLAGTVTGLPVQTATLSPDLVGKLLQSPQLVEDMVRRLGQSKLPADIQTTLARQLQRELQTGRFTLLTIRPLVNGSQQIIYELQARGTTPASAKVLADTGAAAILAWDLTQARSGVQRARTVLTAQLADYQQRLKQATTAEERSSLQSARGALLLKLSQIDVQATGLTGSLISLSSAVEPLTPVAPRPLRNAILAGLAGLLIGSLMALLLDSLRQRVHTADELQDFGLPVLGQVPKIAPRLMRQGLSKLVEHGRLYEAAGFLRVNMLALPHSFPQRRYVISSARPGDGKSTVASILAENLVAQGLRVLLIDADLHQPTQHLIHVTKPSGAPVLTTSTLLSAGPDAAPLQTASGIHLIPAGKASRATHTLTGSAAFTQRIEELSQAYDAVLIDAPHAESFGRLFALTANRRDHCRGGR